MKPSAVIVNTSRGPIIDEDALVDALTRRAAGGRGPRRLRRRAGTRRQPAAEPRQRRADTACHLVHRRHHAPLPGRSRRQLPADPRRAGPSERRQLARVVLVPNPPVIREGRRRMPIAVNPEHNDLADSVRSLVARVAPSDVLHEALETPDLQPAAVLEGRRRAGPAGRPPVRSRWRTRVRHPRTRDRARRVRLRRGARPVRSLGHRQRADRRARPRGQAAERPGVRRGDRRIRHRLRADRHPAGRRPGHPGRGAGGARGRAGVGAGAAGGDRQRRRVGGARRRPAGDRARPERRPAATGGACARQRRRGRRRPRAEQPEPRSSPVR